MKVNAKHRLYDAMLPLWQKMRDAIEGEEKIKAKGDVYLPIPPGTGDGIDGKAYKNYKARARYPDFVAPAIEGMCGLMSRKIKDPEIPDGIKYLEDEATPDGLSLRDLRSRIENEVTSVGRIALFVDVAEEGGNAYIATYVAENFINWRMEKDRLVMGVFYEEVEQVDPLDRFVVEMVPQWRVAEITVNEAGRSVYVVRVYQKKQVKDTSGDDFELISETFPLKKGETLDEVPIVVVGSRDVHPDPDAIPLLSVANKSLHYYRQYADYAMQLFMCANGTTPYIAGAKKDESPASVGPTTVWEFEDPNAKAGFIEVSGTGLDAQKQELDSIKQEISYATVRLLGESKSAEAAETVRLRFQSQTATLSSIAQSSMSGLKIALMYCAEWAGADPESIEADGTAEFITEILNAQILTALYDGIERGMIPDDLLIEYTRRAELHDYDPDEYRKWSAGLMADGTGENEKDDLGNDINPDKSEV